MSKQIPTRSVVETLLSYITIYLGSFFSLPITQQWTGRKLTHEEVINDLEDETVSYDGSLGLDGYFGELVRISLKVEVAQYEKAVAWLSDLIFRSEFNTERYLCLSNSGRTSFDDKIRRIDWK